MSTNLALPQDDRQLCHAEALCVLLSRHDLSDICTWTLGDNGIEGQLSVVYSDSEACDRLRDLAGHLNDSTVLTQPARDGSYTTVSAVGTAQGSPVRFWTHIRDGLARAEEGRG